MQPAGASRRRNKPIEDHRRMYSIYVYKRQCRCRISFRHNFYQACALFPDTITLPDMSTIKSMLLLGALILFQTLQGQDQPFEIQGSLSGAFHGKIYLFFDNHYRQKDSIGAAIIDGKFHFSGRVVLPVLCRMHMDQRSYIQDFYIDGKVTHIICSNKVEIREKEGAVPDTLNKLEILTVDGSATESAKRGFEQWVAQLRQSGGGDEEKSRRHADSLRAFVAQHPGNKASAYLLGEASDLRWSHAKTILQMIDTSLSGTYEYKTAAKLIDHLYKEDRIAGGVPFHDLVLYDTSGRPVDSRQFRGNYVLVEFWASWCGPCMESIPSLRSLYEKNKGNHFVILGVSWDYNKNNWKKAIIKTGMPWSQVIDHDEHNGRLAEYYALDHIPTNILLDPSGKILGNELSMEEIQKLLPRADGNAGVSR